MSYVIKLEGLYLSEGSTWESKIEMARVFSQLPQIYGIPLRSEIIRVDIKEIEVVSNLKEVIPCQTSQCVPDMNVE